MKQHLAVKRMLESSEHDDTGLSATQSEMRQGLNTQRVVGDGADLSGELPERKSKVRKGSKKAKKQKKPWEDDDVVLKLLQ